MALEDGGQFDESLRRLFVAAGQPTLKTCERAMRQRQHAMSVQRISDWRSGRHQPRDFAAVEPLLEWLTARAVKRQATADLLTAQQWQAMWGHGADDPDTPLKDVSPHPTVRPFPGLKVLEADDQAIYFGRAELVVEFTRVVCDVARGGGVPLVVVTGASGAGKSSLLGAGLASATGLTEVARRRPQDGPFASLLAAEVSPASPSSNTVGVLVIDQFEQIFPNPAIDEAEYVDAVIAAAAEHNLIAVIGVRADFFDRCVHIPTLAAAWQRNCVIVPPMTDRQLRDVITGPARLVGCRVDTGLADLMIADVHRSMHESDTAGRLPLLAHVLQATWARRSNGRMTVSGYRATGGVATAVAETAERAWSGIDETQKNSARALLLAMTYMGPDDRPIRASLDQTELTQRFGRQSALVVEEFVSARLLVVENNRVEFVHDAVLEAWPRLRRWINDDRDAAIARRDVDTAAQVWMEANRNDDLLYGAAKVAIVETRVSPDDRLFSRSASEFLTASRRHLRHRSRINQLVLAGVVLLAVVSLAAAAVALIQTQTVADDRNDADFRSLMKQIPALRIQNPSLAAELTLVAHHQRPNDPAVTGNLLATAGIPLQSTLPGHAGAVYGVAYNRAGKLLASAGADRSVQLWRLDTARPTRAGTVGGYGNYVASVAFSPVTPVLATGSGDGTVRLVDVHDPGHPTDTAQPLRPGHGPVYNIAFSPDGRTLAAPSDDGAIYLFDITNPAAPKPLGSPLHAHTGAVRTVAFSPDGKLLASGGDDTTTRLWSMTDPSNPTLLPTVINALGSTNHSVAFDPTGTHLALSGDTENAQVVDISNHMTSHPGATALSATTARSWSTAYGPRAGQLASAGLDGVVHTWRVSSGSQITPSDTLSSISRRDPGAFSVQYSPDGSELAVGYADGTVRIWRCPDDDIAVGGESVGAIATDLSHRLMATTSGDTLRLFRLGRAMSYLASVGIDYGVNDRSTVAVAADGTQVATANNNGGWVHIFHTDHPEAPHPASTIARRTRYTSELAYSPSRTLLAVGDTDTSVQLWDVHDPSHPVRSGPPLTGPHDLITGVAFDRTGGILAVSSDDRSIRLYDLARASPNPVATITTGTTTPAVFAHDSSTLVVGAADGVAVWDTSAPATPRPLGTVGDVAATSFALSPDDKRLAVGTADARLVVYDISDRRQPRTFSDSVIYRADGQTPSEDARWHAVFSSNSQRLVAGYTSTPILRERTLDINTAIERICRRIGAAPSRQEWDESINGVPYQTPCSR